MIIGRGLESNIIEALKSSSLLPLISNDNFKIDEKLFLGIRNNYFNLYYKGASIAKVTLKNNKLCFSIAEKYISLDNDSKYKSISEEEFINNVDKYKTNIDKFQVEKGKMEKIAQQRILINNNINFKMGKSNWFCLDMEYVMERENNSEDSFGRFDLIAISKKQSGEKHKIALIELKYGTSAFSDFSDEFKKQYANDNKSFYNGKIPVKKIGSGILGHAYDYIRYLNSGKYKTALKKEIINILNNYNELGLINSFERIEEDDIDDIPNVYFITLENKNDKCSKTMKNYLCRCKDASKYNVEEVLGIDITKSNDVFNPIFLFAEDDGSNIIDMIEEPSYKKGLQN